jgi:hypothetical protein
MAKKDTKELDRIIADINKSVSEIRKRKPRKIKDSELPSNLKIMLSGVSNSKALDFLFSNRLDVILEKLMDMIMTGELLTNVEKFFSNEKDIKDLFSSLGFGEGSFEGPVSTTILNSVRDSMEDNKYLKMKSETDKIKYIYRNMKMKWWNFWNKPELRKKYEQAMYAIEEILKIVSNVYKNRERIIKGLGNIVVESVNESIQLERII